MPRTGTRRFRLIILFVTTLIVCTVTASALSSSFAPWIYAIYSFPAVAGILLLLDILDILDGIVDAIRLLR